MTESVYTDEQIIKALGCCRDFGDCSLCPYEEATFSDELDCTERLHTDALDLINRQRAEIERLTVLAELGNVRANDYRAMRDKAKNARAEAIKEFAERLKKECLVDRGYEILQEGTIDHLVKEMTEGKQ